MNPIRATIGHIAEAGVNGATLEELVDQTGYPVDTIMRHIHHARAEGYRILAVPHPEARTRFVFDSSPAVEENAS